MTADYAIRNYPGAAVKTNLTTGMNGTDTTTDIADSTGWPTSAFWLLLDAGLTTEELVYVATRASLHLSGIVRNITGGGAFTHSSGGTKTCWPTGSFQDFVEFNAIAAALTTKGDSLWKGGTASVAPARLAAGTDQQIIRYLAANSLGVETTHKGSIPIFASTAARDTAIPSPSAGQACYINAAASTDGLQFYNGTSWRPVSWNAPWGIVASATKTTAQNGISTIVDVTSMSITFTRVAGRQYRLSAIGSFTNASVANAGAELDITDTVPNRLAFGGVVLPATGTTPVMTVTPWVLTSGAAGSVTYKLRIAITSGTVDFLASASVPAFILAEDLGPSGVPT